MGYAFTSGLHRSTVRKDSGVQILPSAFFLRKMPEYYQVWISAESENEAKELLKRLTSSKFLVGGTILNGPSRFWWKGEETDMDYYYIMGFTIKSNKKILVKEAENLSKEEVPMISFVSISGNKKFLDYIKENIKNNIT